MKLETGQIVKLKVPEGFHGRLNPGDIMEVRVTQQPGERDTMHGYHFSFEKMIRQHPNSNPPVPRALIFEKRCSYISRGENGRLSRYQIIFNDTSHDTDTWKMPT